MSSVSSAKKLRVALVHDFLREYGGAERVVEALHELFPDAPLYTAFTDRSAMGIHWQKFADWDIRQSWMSKIPFHRRFFSPLRIIAAACFRSFDFSNYDVVISSSNAYFAKAVQVPHPAIHICYCHTPPRSLYGYSTMTDWQKNPVIHVAGTLINHVCRVIDVRAAQKVDYFLANSAEVQGRIQKFYRRDSTIIFPPVNLSSEPVSDQKVHSKKPYYLYVNRLAFSKHPELAVAACTQLGRTLKVVGTGKMETRLRQVAGPTIEFVGAVKDEYLAELYQGAEALLYPVEDEDFGIVPVEAMGHGVPVIAHRSGGPQETIIGVDAKHKNMAATGLFFDDLSTQGVIDAIQEFEALQKEAKTRFDRQKIHLHAQSFSKTRFQKEIKQFMEKSLHASITSSVLPQKPRY